MKNGENSVIPVPTIERLILYRRLLQRLADQGETHLYSHDLAELANNTPAQVRRDLMIIGYSGSPAKGYVIEDLANRINALFKKEKGQQKTVLVGLGNLGRAVLAHINERDGRFHVVAAFDSDPAKASGTLGDCPCRPAGELVSVIVDQKVSLGIITVPAEAAQHVADLMIVAGIKGILNFAPVRLKAPAHVFVDDVDILTKLEKLAFFCD